MIVKLQSSWKFVSSSTAHGSTQLLQTTISLLPTLIGSPEQSWYQTEETDCVDTGHSLRRDCRNNLQTSQSHHFPCCYRQDQDQLVRVWLSQNTQVNLSRVLIVNSDNGGQIQRYTICKLWKVKTISSFMMKMIRQLFVLILWYDRERWKADADVENFQDTFCQDICNNQTQT